MGSRDLTTRAVTTPPDLRVNRKLELRVELGVKTSTPILDQMSQQHINPYTKYPSPEPALEDKFKVEEGTEA